MKNKLKGVLSIYDNFAMYHDYDDLNGLGPAKNLTIDTMRLLVKSVIDLDKDISEMSFKNATFHNVISFDSILGDVIFWTEPEMRKLYFKNGDIESGNYKVPYLLWKYRNGHGLSIYALKGKPKSLDTEIYQAPFHNVYDGGSVCMGSAKINKNIRYFDDLIDEIIDKFFGSFFTHKLGNPLKVDYKTFMFENKDNTKLVYNKYLRKLNKTLKDVL